MTSPTSEETAIVLTTRWLRLGPAFFIFRIFVAVDGFATSVVLWGEHVFPVAPGAHEVEVSLGLGFGRRHMGEARIQVEVAQGKSAHLRYRPPFQFAVQQGEIEIIH